MSVQTMYEDDFRILKLLLGRAPFAGWIFDRAHISIGWIYYLCIDIGSEWNKIEKAYDFGISSWQSILKNHTLKMPVRLVLPYKNIYEREVLWMDAQTQNLWKYLGWITDAFITKALRQPFGRTGSESSYRGCLLLGHWGSAGGLNSSTNSGY